MEQDKIISNAQQLLDVRNPINTKDIIQNIKDNINNGNVNPLEAYSVLKRMSKVVEAIIDDEDIKNKASIEFDKYASELKGKKSIEVYGAQICKMPTYTWYDFTQCGHPTLDALYEIQKVVKDQIKLIEDELKLMIPKDDYKPGSIPGFGIESTTKQKLIETIPELIWNEINEVVPIEQPKKIQKIGLKYMKL